MTSSVPQAWQTGDRHFSIDLLRAISISAVVYYHALFAPINAYGAVAISELILIAPLRFCVPMFLTLSFILFEHRLHSVPHRSPLEHLKFRIWRLLKPVGFWFAIAILLEAIATDNTRRDIAQETLTGTIFIGSDYLLILLQLTLLYPLLRSLFRHPLTLPSLALLQGLVFIGVHGLLWTQTHPASAQALTILTTLQRPLILYWLLYLGLGHFCYTHWDQLLTWSRRLTPQIKIAGLLGYAIAASLEFYLLTQPGFANLYPFEYALITASLSPLLLLLCCLNLTPHSLPPWAVTLIRQLSRYSLGIYCINGIGNKFFSVLARPLFAELSLNLWQVSLIRFGGWLILLSLSYWLAIGLAHWGCKPVVQ
ncbi:acyltransferase family protein [Spirulina major]|uniref:acyltransferase family protein n=1 Tax=Spirulina major TaxID=270636 RepID=UPI0009325A7D|nr:acyltransferase family protein [Spirulina major]